MKNCNMWEYWYRFPTFCKFMLMCKSCSLFYLNSLTLDTVMKRMILIFAFLLIFVDIKANRLYRLFDGDDKSGYSNIWVNSQVFIYKEEKIQGNFTPIVKYWITRFSWSHTYLKSTNMLIFNLSTVFLLLLDALE